LDIPLLYATAVLTLGIGAQWLAWRVRLPAILVLLILGFAVGEFFFGLGAKWLADSSGGLFRSPDELIGRDLLFSIVSLSVAVILFEGGLSLRIRELRETGRAVLGLVTVGVLVTWLLTAVAARFVLDFKPGMALLAGAILVVSGPTVIVPLLRHVRPVRRVGSMVKWEGIVNDPIGAVLAVLIFAAVSGAAGAGGVQEVAIDTLAGLAFTVLTGGGIACAAAFLLVQMLKRYWVPDFLQNVVFLAAQEFTEFFGRAEVYQLAVRSTEVDRREPVSQDRMGRVLFAAEVGYGRLAQRLAAGAVVKATGLSDEFDYQAFRNLYGDSAVVLFAVEESGELTVSTVDNPVTPRPGQTLISLVDPVEPAPGDKQ